MVFLKVVLVGLASPRGLTVQCFPQEYSLEEIPPANCHVTAGRLLLSPRWRRGLVPRRPALLWARGGAPPRWQRAKASHLPHDGLTDGVSFSLEQPQNWPIL